MFFESSGGAFMRQTGTLFGCIAVVIWSFSIILLLQLRSLPILSLVGYLYLASSVPSIVKLSVTKRWHEVHRSWKKWAIGVFLLALFQYCVTMGVRYLHPAAAELIVQLWPTCIVLLIGLLPRESFNIKYLVPIFVGVMGVWVLFWNQSSFLPLTWAIVFPVTACLAWCGYVLFSRLHENDPPEMIGLYLGVGGLLTFCITFFSGNLSFPTPSETFFLLLLGVGVLGVAQLMWDQGVKGGDVKVMAIFANINPALALGWLILFGYANPSVNLFISYALTLIASLYAYYLSFKSRKLQKF